MSSGVVTAAYIVAAILFILALQGYPNMKPQNRGITLVLQGWLSRYLRLSLGLMLIM